MKDSKGLISLNGVEPLEAIILNDEEDFIRIMGEEDDSDEYPMYLNDEDEEIELT